MPKDPPPLRTVAAQRQPQPGPWSAGGGSGGPGPGASGDRPGLVGRRFRLPAGLPPPNSRLWLGAAFVYAVTAYWMMMADLVFWRDEALPLLIAKSHPSLMDLFGTFGYEGSPGLWHVLLWLAGQLVPLTPGVAKLIHFGFFAAAAAVYLFLFKVPLSLKLLVLFSYPAVFTYARQVRQYQLAVALIALFFYVYAAGGSRRHLGLHVILFFLAQTCLHGLVLAMVMFAFLAGVRHHEEGRLWHPAGLVAFAGFALAVAQLWPPPDLMVGIARWDTSLGPAKIAGILRRFAGSVIWPDGMFLTSMVVMGAVAWPNRWIVPRREIALALTCFGAACAAFLMIGFFKISWQHHYGLLTCVVCGFMLAVVQRTGGRIVGGSRLKAATVAATVAVLVVGNGYEFTRRVLDVRATLRSNCRNAARYLDRHFPDAPVLSQSEIFEAPVRLYRRHPVPVYALGRQAFVVHTVWNHPSVDWRADPSVERFRLSDVIRHLRSVPEALLKKNPILIISGYLPLEQMNDLGLDRFDVIRIDERLRVFHVAAFTGAERENYHLFRVEYRTAPPG